MQLWIHLPRKDGKWPVTLGFDNGKRIKKIVTYEQLQDLKEKISCTTLKRFDE